MPGPSREAKAIEAWAEKHDAVMTENESRIARFARNAADYLVNETEPKSPAMKDRCELDLAAFERIVPQVEARLREG